MSDAEVKDRWIRHWTMGGSIEENSSPVGNWLRKQRLQIMCETLATLDKTLSAIDMGCGNGSTLQVLRESGFKNSIGIEYVEEGIKHAEEERGFRRGIDIFQMDAKSTTFQDRHFGLVYSEGLWEHFTDPRPYMDEFMRISDRYIMVIQPNHYSPAGWLLKVLWDMLASGRGGVVEYSFKISYFVDYLRERGFKLIQYRSTIFNEMPILLFERC